MEKDIYGSSMWTSGGFDVKKPWKTMDFFLRRRVRRFPGRSARGMVGGANQRGTRRSEAAEVGWDEVKDDEDLMGFNRDL